uniref:7TM_GPCR_Srx domain-containing protein n=1 Tax=Haemonchus contortus TaxID=6289 RepID=A0A7I4XZS7_HAECO|nr:C. briggsae CBR-SRX-1 protein [Haemonchus contortus]
MDIIRLIIGFFFNMEVWIVLIMNIFVFVCMIKGRLFWIEDNPVYVLVGFSILCETCQVLLHAFFIGPSFVKGDFLFGGLDTSGVMAIDTLFISFWYMGSLVQILLAINRLAVVYLPSEAFFTHRRVLILIAFCCMATVGITMYTQFTLPCCRIVPNPRIYGYSYSAVSNETYNFAMTHVDIPLFLTTSVLAGISYFAFFKHIIDTGGGAGSKGPKYALQFLLMFLAYTSSWLMFFLFPIMGVQTPEAYVLTAVTLVANCGTNSVVYLVVNREVRYAAKQFLSAVGLSPTRKVPKKFMIPNKVHPQNLEKF